MKKCISIDEYLGQPSGTFLKNVEKLNEEYREIERERKERIKRVREASKRLDAAHNFP